MKKLLINILSLTCIVMLMASCGDEVKPTNKALDSAILSGAWSTTSREVTVSVKRGEGNDQYYTDSTYTESSNIVFTFGAAGVKDSVVVDLTELIDPNPPKLTTSKGNFSFGEAGNIDYSANKQYIIIYESALPHKKESGFFTTYTVNSMSANSMELVWSINNSTRRNSVAYKATFTK